ncbi:hypothetical protein LP420_02945 [Massilia sp. B-10]|nr:hypothetical protein LP420_02945 [Massilia sp. B-10]
MRLECKVNIAIIKTEIPFWVRATINTFLVTTDWCNKIPIYLSVTPEMEAGKATLVHGERRRELGKGSGTTASSRRWSIRRGPMTLWSSSNPSRRNSAETSQKRPLENFS